jgi:hypothetical protein
MRDGWSSGKARVVRRSDIPLRLARGSAAVVHGVDMGFSELFSAKKRNFQNCLATSPFSLVLMAILKILIFCRKLF